MLMLQPCGWQENPHGGGFPELKDDFHGSRIPALILLVSNPGRVGHAL